MAKSKAFFGLRSGSTKSHTYQVYRGQQITKDRVNEVKNPQTSAQMAQRLKLVAVAQAAARLSGLVDHSFQSVEYGYKSIAEFRRLNLSDSNLKITGYVPKGANGPGVADFIVSNGSLPKRNVGYHPTTNGFFMDGFQHTALSSDLFPAGKEFDTIAATEANAKAIAGLLGVEVGDQITYLLQVTAPDMIGTYDNAQFHPSMFVIARMVTDYNDENFMKGWARPKGGTFTNGLIAVSDEWTDGGIDVTIWDEESVATDPSVPTKWPASIETPSALIVQAAAVIISRKNGDVWQRSPQRLVVNTNDAALLMCTSYADAEPTYLKNSASTQKYLNSGTDTVTIVGGE